MKNHKKRLITFFTLLTSVTALQTASAQSSTECPSLHIEDIRTHPAVQQALADAWRDSFIGPAHEEGGNIYQCFKEGSDGSRVYEYVIRRSPSGSEDGLVDPPPLNDPNCRLVAAFHTHPGPKSSSPHNDGYDNERASPEDYKWGVINRVPQIISFQVLRNRRYDMTIPVDDNGHVKATNPSWECPEDPISPTKKPLIKGPVSSSHGDPHLKTIDGRTYDFQSAGEFVFCRSDQGNLEIQVRQEPSPNNQRISFNTALAVEFEGETLGFYVNPPAIWHNDQEIYGKIDEHIFPEEIYLKQEGKSSYQLKIGESLLTVGLYASYLNFQFNPSTSLKNHVVGLAGNFNGEESDDLVIPQTDVPTIMSNEYIHQQFGEHWRVSKGNSLFRYDRGKAYEDYHLLDYPNTYVNPAYFPPEQYAKAKEICRAAGIDQFPALSNCIYDVILTKDPEIAKDYADFQLLTAKEKTENHTSGSNGFTFHSFPDDNNLEIGPWVSVKDGTLRIMDYERTPRFVTGFAHYHQPVKVKHNFEIGFEFSISQIDGKENDGFAFVMSERYFRADPKPLGYSKLLGALAIEFDTHQNEYDPSNNHLSFQANSGYIRINDQYALATTSDIPNLTDGQIHKVKIVYQDKNLAIFLDNMAKPVILTFFNMEDLRFEDDEALVGFTSYGTPELGKQVHYIHSWYFRGF